MAILSELKKIVVTGGNGFLGKHVIWELQKRGVKDGAIHVPRKNSCDLRRLENCEKLLEGADLVIHLAASVGGIGYGINHGGELFYDNIAMGINVVEASRTTGVKKLVVAGSVCSYPKNSPIPLQEQNLWMGYPEETNAPYGVAKLALLEMLHAYRQQYGLNGIFLLPVNLFGPHDNFDPERSHVIPAMIYKFSRAMKAGDGQVTFWGDGTATREFLFISEAARAVVLSAEVYDGASPINLGSGEEITIKQLAELVREKIGFRGKILWDISRPSGQPRRKLDISRAEEAIGFRSSTSLTEGLDCTIQWWKNACRAGLIASEG